MKIIAQGAEARIYKDGKNIVKNRFSKSYRVLELDTELRKSRTRREAKVLQKIPVKHPKLININDKDMIIEMEFIDGKKVKDILNAKNCEAMCKHIGSMTAKMHNEGIIHSDLTTSNMIITSDDPKDIHFIDFGLSFFNGKVEDKAVDIHIFKQALESAHHELYEQSMKAFLKGYKKTNNYDAILQRLDEVEARGRYKRKH